MIRAPLTTFGATLILFAALTSGAPTINADAPVDSVRYAKFLDDGVLKCLRTAMEALNLQGAVIPNSQSKLAANNSKGPEARGQQDLKTNIPSICKMTDGLNEVVQGFTSCLAMHAKDNKLATAKLVMEEIKQAVCSKGSSLQGQEHWGYLQERLKNDSILRKKIVDIFVQVGEFEYSMEAIKQMTTRPANGCFSNKISGWTPDAPSSFQINDARVALMTEAYEKVFGASGYVLDKENGVLGTGRFGIVFKVHKANQTNTKYAMKIAKCGTLKHEHKAMTNLQHLDFIPRVYGQVGMSADGWWDFFVMELVGKSIFKAREEGLVWAEEYNQFIRLVWDQVRLLHVSNSTKCYSHGDLHAGNLAVDNGEFKHQKLYIIDYGMSWPCSKNKMTAPVMLDYVHLALDIRDNAPRYGSAINGKAVYDTVTHAKEMCLVEKSGASIKDCLATFEPRVVNEFKRAGADLCDNRPLWLSAAKIAEEKARLTTKPN